MNKDILSKAALVVGGIAIGSGTTYLIVNKKLRSIYLERAEDEIKSTKEFYALMHSKPPYDNPSVALAKYNERMDQLEFWSANGIPGEEYEDPEIFNEMATDPETGEFEAVQQLIEDNQYSLPDETSPEQNAGEKKVSEMLKRAQENMDVVVNPPKEAKTVLTLDDVSASPADIPDIVTGEQQTVSVFDKYEEPDPKELRDKEFPYIIGESEFFETEMQYEKTDLIYYVGGNGPILADLKGQIVHDVVGLLGKDTLKHFGYDTKNPMTLFVRNDKRKVDLDISLDERSYAEVVMGVIPED